MCIYKNYPLRVNNSCLLISSLQHAAIFKFATYKKAESEYLNAHIFVVWMVNMSVSSQFDSSRSSPNVAFMDNLTLLAPNVRRVRHIQTISILNITCASEKTKDTSLTSSTVCKRSVKPDKCYADGTVHGVLPSQKECDSLERVLDNDQDILNQENPIKKQKILQELRDTTFFDTFYTLNKFMDIDSPFYISRIFHGGTNIQEDVNFEEINENSLSLNLLINYKGKWCFLNQYHIMLPLMKCIGDDLKKINRLFWKKPNFLTIKFSDNCCYIPSNSNVPKDVINTLQKRQIQRSQQKAKMLCPSRLTTCTYDQIMKLNNLRTCVKDLVNIKKTICDQLHFTTRSANARPENRRVILSSIDALESTLDNKQLYNVELSRRIGYMRLSINQKKNLINNILNPSLKYYPKPRIDSIENDLRDNLSQFDQIEDDINIEKARIAKDILYIFPIQRVSTPNSSSLKKNYELLGYKFPPSSTRHRLLSILIKLQRAQMLRLSALTGYISYIINLYAHYLRVTLRYPIRYLGSRSYIRDFVSPKATKNGVFPLFLTQNTTLALKFTYGLMLLTSDLEQLFNNEQLYKIDDLNLLFNLHTFLQGMATYGTNFENQVDSVGKHNCKQLAFNIGTESQDPGERIAFSKRALNQTLVSQERESHIRKHLLRNINDV